MSFAGKLLSRIMGPVLQVAGLIGSAIPESVQEGITNVLLSYLTDPAVYVPSIVVGTIFTTLAYGSMWAEHQIKSAGGITGREFAANFKEWDRVTKFPVWQVAWLWKNMEPQNQNEKTEGTAAYPAFRRLKEDLEKGLIKDAEKVNDSWLWATIPRQKLIDYALAVNERPKFLFPDERRSWITRKLFRLFRREIPNSDLPKYQTMSDLQYSIYRYLHQNGQTPSIETQITPIIKHWLESGEWEAIGRKKINELLFAYQPIPQWQWQDMDFDFSSARWVDDIYCEVMVRQVVNKSQGEVSNSKSSQPPM